MRIFGVPITNLKPCSPSNVYIRDTFLHCSPALFHHLFSKVSGHHIVKVKIDGSLFYYTAILEPAISVKDQIAIMSTPAMEAGTFSSDISLIDEINSITTPILLSIESTPGYEEDSQTSQARMQQYSDYQRVLSHADSIMNNLFLEQVRSLQAGIVFYLYLDDDHQPIILKPQFGYNDGCFISVGIKTELEIIPVIPPKGIRLRVRAAPEGSTISLISEKEEIVKGFDRGHQVLISLQLNSILYKVEALISELPSSGWVWISSGPDKDQQISYTQHQWVTLLSIETIHRGPVRAKMHKELTAYDDMDILHDRLSREGDRITGTNTCSMILLKGEARGGKTTLILDYQNYGKSPLLVIQLQKLDRSQWLCQLSKLAEHVAPNCAIALDTFQDINPDDAQFILEKINILRYCWSCPIILVVESTSDLPPCFSNSPGWHPDGPVEIKRKSRLWCLSTIQSHQAENGHQTMATTSPPQKIPPDSFSLNKIKPVVRWKDIPALEGIKQILEETIFWPAKFFDIYTSNGISTPGGVLLTGPSGTGKTFLINSFCDWLKSSILDIDIVRVNGPELLQKYVGASEQAIREIFQRARGQTPSLIVFDELDALATRRGSDQSGITDRVVNQLLTEIDGTGDRAGVHLIGITSRLDLIDPALIRSGRIDVHINFDFPSFNDRLSILKYYLPADLHHRLFGTLKTIARKTKGLTGAHLRSILLDSQIISNRRIKSFEYPKSTEHSMETEDLLQALSEQVRPKADSGSYKSDTTSTSQLN